MKTAIVVAGLLTASTWLWPIDSVSLEQAVSAEKEAKQEAEKKDSPWRFSFDPKDFLMTVQYYGPEPERFITVTAGTDSHRELLDQRAAQPKNTTFIATSQQILNWRSAMHPAGWSGDAVTPGEFEPAEDYVGYVIQIESAGKPMYAKLGWQLETYDSLSTLSACCWGTNRETFGPLLKALGEQRRTWAEARYESLLSNDWHRLVVSTGSGSCWGESCSPKLEVVRAGESVRIKPAGGGDKEGYAIADESKALTQFQDTLHRYAVHLELHGHGAVNYFKVYKIELQETPAAKLKTVFYGYEALSKPLDDKQFDKWVAETLKSK